MDGVGVGAWGLGLGLPRVRESVSRRVPAPAAHQQDCIILKLSGVDGVVRIFGILMGLTKTESIEEVHPVIGGYCSSRCEAFQGLSTSACTLDFPEVVKPGKVHSGGC